MSKRSKNKKIAPDQKEKLEENVADHKPSGKKNTLLTVSLVIISLMLVLIGGFLIAKFPSALKEGNPQQSETPSTIKSPELKETRHLILDRIPSNLKKSLNYIVLSGEDNSYIIGISENENINNQFKTKKLTLGMLVTIESTKPIKLKNEPKELTELRKRLKNTKLVMLKDILPIQTKFKKVD
jgi:hypothetical protein